MTTTPQNLDPKSHPSDHPLSIGSLRKIGTYHRVSTVDGDPSLARTELRAYAQRLGTLVLEEEEQGSGARSDRAGLIRVMEAARRGQIDALVVWKLDRLSRSVIDLHSTAAQLDSYGVRLACVTQAIDTGNAAGRLLFTVLAAVSAFERDTIIERTRLGIAKARRAGKTFGRPKHSHITCEQVIALRADGKSWRSCAMALGCTPSLARLRYLEGNATHGDGGSR